VTWGRRVTIGFGWAAVVVGLFGVFLHLTSSTAKALILLASFAPYLMLGGLLGLVVLAIAKQWIGVAVSGLVIGAAVATQLPAYVANGTPGSGPELTVMQTNILFGGGDVGVVVDEVRRNGVDLLTISELTDDGLARLETAGVGTELPHRYVAPGPGGSGTGMWSRYPLDEHKRYNGFALAQLSARMLLPDGQAVTVFALHPVPPYPVTEQWVSEMRGVEQILAGVTTGPAIVGADMNSTTDHSLFRSLLSTRFENAAGQVGAGMVATFPAEKWYPAIIGIDHILLADARAERVRTVEIPNADHLAIIADVRLD
jgi:endonuclease/exonuclease/phosphatase (EEP) superfamily protein YafD